MSELTHFDKQGQAHMVDVGAKQETQRVAVVSGMIKMLPNTLQLILKGDAKKGDVLGIARLAGIMGAKKTPDLIPLCHSISLTKVSIEFETDVVDSTITCLTSVQCVGKTGVEMEALTATSIALLTIYDMCKAVDRGMVISDIKLLEKQGGNSGYWALSE